jgi:hypothetical protein
MAGIKVLRLKALGEQSDAFKYSFMLKYII